MRRQINDQKTLNKRLLLLAMILLWVWIFLLIKTNQAVKTGQQVMPAPNQEGYPSLSIGP
jgi:hypothetical protein